MAPPTAYATVADLTNYGMAAATLGALTAAQQTAAINAANGVVDSYLGSKFKLPITAWGPEMTRAAAVLAAYDLIVIRGFDPEDPGDAAFIQRAKDVLGWLELISKGEVTPASIVDSLPGGAPGAPGTVFVQQALSQPLPGGGSTLGGQQTTIALSGGNNPVVLSGGTTRGFH